MHATLPLAKIRARIRAGEHSGSTSGMVPAHVQGNVVILPKEEHGRCVDVRNADVSVL